MIESPAFPQQTKIHGRCVPSRGVERSSKTRRIVRVACVCDRVWYVTVRFERTTSAIVSSVGFSRSALHDVFEHSPRTVLQREVVGGQDPMHEQRLVVAFGDDYESEGLSFLLACHTCVHRRSARSFASRSTAWFVSCASPSSAHEHAPACTPPWRGPCRGLPTSRWTAACTLSRAASHAQARVRPSTKRSTKNGERARASRFFLPIASRPSRSSGP